MCAWIFVAVFFYHHVEGFSYTVSFFYAMNVGLGVGYSFPLCSHPVAKLYTCLHVMLGTSFIMGALQLFFQSFLALQSRVYTKRRRYNFMRLGKSRAPRLADIWWRMKQCEYRIWLFVLWAGYVALGVWWGTTPGNLNSDADPIDALLFVITSMSTAAQVSQHTALALRSLASSRVPCMFNRPTSQIDPQKARYGPNMTPGLRYLTSHSILAEPHCYSRVSSSRSASLSTLS
jgi:hypothetical protein